MQTFEEYKERYATFHGITDEERLKLAYLIDSRLEEAKVTVGSANFGVGYWIAEKLMREGYRDTNGLAAVLKEATDEAIKRMNEDLGRRFIPVKYSVASFGKSGSIIDLDKELEKIRSDRKNAVNEYLIQRDKEVRKETAKEIYKAVLDLRELMVNSDDALCILRNVESWAKEDGVEVEE